MDDPGLSEARLSALASQLDKTLERALAGAKPAPDELDERQERIMRVIGEAG
jgi:hypothetical protein